MNTTVHARHMDITDAIREYAEDKIAKLPKYYDGIQSIEVILDIEAGKPLVEIVAQGGRKHTFVAHHRDAQREGDMYACIDQCVDKISQQVRRHKDRVRDRQT